MPCTARWRRGGGHGLQRRRGGPHDCWGRAQPGHPAPLPAPPPHAATSGRARCWVGTDLWCRAARQPLGAGRGSTRAPLGSGHPSPAYATLRPPPPPSPSQNPHLSTHTRSRVRRSCAASTLAPPGPAQTSYQTPHCRSGARSPAAAAGAAASRCARALSRGGVRWCMRCRQLRRATLTSGSGWGGGKQCVCAR